MLLNLSLIIISKLIVSDPIYFQNLGPHYHHFHVYLQPPTAKSINPNLLLASNVDVANTTESKLASSGELLAKAKVKLTSQLAKKIEQALKRELELGGLCSDANSDARSFTSGYEPGVADPQTYVEVSLKEHNITSPKVIDFSKIKIVQQPKHGRLATQIVNERNNEGYFNYIPNKGYWGKDNAIFEVAVNQFKIRVEYQFNVGTDDSPNMDACDPSYSWLNNEGTNTADFPSNKWGSNKWNKWGQTR